MGIRKKIFLGFIIIGLILFTSGMISLFQLMRIEKTVSGLNVNNIRSIEASGKIFDEAKKQTWKILDIMHNNSQNGEARIIFNDTLYRSCLDFILQNITIPEEKKMFDILQANYQLFKHQTVLLDSVFLSGNVTERNEWLNTKYRPVYESFIKAAHDLEIFNQNTMLKNSTELEANFYRLVTPLIVALAIGLFLVILFNYFINIYFINPILKIIAGLKEYSENKQPYNVKIDTRDEIYELNREIKSLISHTKQKESVGVYNFNK
ncbi:MAG: MCP four helix bundle domain-containing protein [Prevotellaceae bacterium]|nr:MCP four helix bundle domain-containing protein [Prevotellaceae bacterium]